MILIPRIRLLMATNAMTRRERELSSNMLSPQCGDAQISSRTELSSYMRWSSLERLHLFRYRDRVGQWKQT